MTTRFSNREIAKLLNKIGDLLEIKGENRFRVLAYRKAADNINDLGQDLFDLWRESDESLEDVPGIGEAISDKISELFKTGELEYWHRLTAEVPESLSEVMNIPDVGPKATKLMWEELGITTVAEVKEAAEAGKIRELPRMGEKTERRILNNIKAMEVRETDRVHLGIAWPRAQQVIDALQDVSAVQKIEVAGSLRRRRESIGDLDLLVATEDAATVMEAFRSLPEVAEIIGTGETKTSLRFEDGLQADLRCLAPKHWGTALQYFTGSKNHNVHLREMVQDMGYMLNEYALTDEESGEETFFDTEAELYEFIGLKYIPPYLREDWGEIDAAKNDNLPQGVTVEDIRGEGHCHSDWSDGATSIEEMARAAKERGYQYLVITDHSQSLGVANGLTPERLREQRAEIEKVQERVSGIRIWQGTEMEIKADGSLDFPDDVLAELDFVVASIHTSLKQDRDTLTQRALNAIHNPHVKVLGHPTGRLVSRRDPGDFDMEAIFKAAAETGTLLEINASPERLDLNASHVRRAIEHGVQLMINCDAHAPHHFDNLHFGTATASRGWANPQNIANTLALDEFEAKFVKR